MTKTDDFIRGQKDVRAGKEFKANLSIYYRYGFNFEKGLIA